MRHAYLVSRTHDGGGCRGGVGSDYCEDYALEIGNDYCADTTMISLCVHVDEIMEYLELSKSPMAKMLLHSMHQETKRLDTSLDKSRK